MTSFTSVTNDVVEILRERIGTPITSNSPRPYVTVATQDAICHWCYGIGDYNPLYLDPDYAASGPYHGITAPPSMLYAFDKRMTGGVMGLPGLTAMFAGVRWEWRLPVREGDRVSVESAILKDVIEREGSFGGRELQVISELTLCNQDGAVVAVSNPYGFRLERGEAVKRAKYKGDERHVYTPDELEGISAEVLAEARRGTEPLVPERLQPGDSIGSIVRGPITVSDIIVFLMGWGGQYIRSHGDWVEWAKRHPSGYLRNSQNIPDTIEAVHWDAELVQTVGVPAPYDYGPQRVAWAISLLTNWMGDAAWLSMLELSLRRHVVVGDTIWISGTVRDVVRETDGSQGQDRFEINVDLSMRNQRGDVVARGGATIQTTGT